MTFYLVAAILVMGLALITLNYTTSRGITGFASSQPTNVSVTVSGTNPVNVYNISNLSVSSFNPTEDSVTQIIFYVSVNDSDGVSDINTTSVSANFTKVGEGLRYNSSCVYLANINAYSANFSCTIAMWYFDSSGVWNVSVSATDLGNLSFRQNLTTNFTFNQLKAMISTPNSLSFSVVPGTTNQSASNDPTVINNTGNFNGTVTITGLNLYGATDGTQKIDVANFTVNRTTGGECVSTSTPLVNGSATSIAQSTSNRGNRSLGGGVGQENFYYCMRAIPIVPSQAYTTGATSSWTISY